MSLYYTKPEIDHKLSRLKRRLDFIVHTLAEGGGGLTTELDGNAYTIQQEGNNLIFIDPTAGSESSLLRAANNTDNGNTSTLSVATTNTQSRFNLLGGFNGGDNQVSIVGTVTASNSTIIYNAITHRFDGAVAIGDDPEPNYLFQITDANINSELSYFDIVSFTSYIAGSDGTAITSLSLSGNLGSSSVSFNLTANDNIHSVSIAGDAVGQILSLTGLNVNIAGKVGIGMTANSPFAVSGLTAYANNAAAISGGLASGDFYYTNVAGDGIIKRVI